MFVLAYQLDLDALKQKHEITPPRSDTVPFFVLVLSFYQSNYESTQEKKSTPVRTHLLYENTDIRAHR